MISVVVPVLNEGDAIAATLAAAADACPGAELIVVDGGSLDSTVQLAQEAGARVVHAPRGRGTQLDAGVAAATGEIIVMLHADTRLPPGAEEHIRACLGVAGTAAGAFRIRFPRAEIAHAGGALRRLEWWLNARSRWFGFVTGDQAIFTTAAMLRRIGGVPAVPLFEDVRLVQALRRAGNVIVLDAAVETSPRLFLRHGPWRTACLHALFRVLHAAGVPPARLAAWYPATAA